MPVYAGVDGVLPLAGGFQKLTLSWNLESDISIHLFSHYDKSSSSTYLQTKHQHHTWLTVRNITLPVHHTWT